MIRFILNFSHVADITPGRDMLLFIEILPDSRFRGNDIK